jgi:hypothetical protein
MIEQIHELRRVYGKDAADVLESILRGSAISWLSGGSGDGSSMLSIFYRGLRQALDRPNSADDLPDFEHDDRLDDLLTEFETRLPEFGDEAINEALEEAREWKLGKADLALLAVCRKLRVN